MNGTLFEDAFAHHVWVTTRLIDACLALNTKQVTTAVPGTYGSIIETMRHLVEGDSDYLSIMTGDRTHLIDTEHMDLPELRVVMENESATDGDKPLRVQVEFSTFARTSKELEAWAQAE